jgi:hypothetical protein
VDPEKIEIALKYLDLARGEILEKARFVNQTLGAYLLGSSALASWFYQTIYRPASTPASSVPEAQKAAAAIGLAILLAYLALGVNWITHHNERIITALALYQSTDLAPVLGDLPPMWERSASLLDADGLSRAFFTVLIEELIILGPPVAAFVFAAGQRHQATWLAHACLGGALLANLASAIVGALMFQSKRKLRSGTIAAGALPRVPERSIPNLPQASK